MAPAHPAFADVTDGGGSADFMLKTVTPGQVGPSEQDIYVPGGDWYGYPDTPPNGTLVQTPAVVNYTNQLWVIALSTDQQLYQNYYDPTYGWSGWAALPTLANGVTSAPTAVTYSNGPGGSSAINVFVRGGDNNIWQTVYGGGAWGAWSSPAPPGTTLGSAPAAVNYTGNGDWNRVDIMWLDSGSQNYMHLIYSPTGGWSAPSADGCCYTSAPAVAQYQSTFQEWGVGQDGKVYQRVYSPSGGWSGYSTWSSDTAGSAPAVTQFTVGTDYQFQVFYVFGNTANTWTTNQLVYDPNAGGWQSPITWGLLSSAPSVIQYSGQLQLWSRDPQRAGPGATDCAHGSNLGDNACVNGHNGERYTATEAIWADNNLNVVWDPYNPKRFILNGMWIYTSTNLAYQLEEGTIYGTCVGYYGSSAEDRQTNICPQGTDLRQPYAFRYWADSKPGKQWVHWMGWWTVNDNVQHGYELQRDPNNPCNWYIYVDGIREPLPSTIQYCPNGLSYAYEDQVGLENNGFIPTPGDESKGPFPYTDLYYSNTVSDEQLQTWHDGQWYPWEYQYSWNRDEPCDQNHRTNCYTGANDNSNTIWRVSRIWDRGP